MILIKEYSDVVKRSFGISMNQGRFMREVFKASGYDRFPSSSDEDYAKKICNGSKPITDDMIAGFPKPYWIEELADYFVKHIDKKKVPTLANAFKIADKSIDIDCICKALAAQFFGLVEVGGADHTADDIVASSYRKLRDGADIKTVIAAPYHSGDRAWIVNGQRSRHYNRGFYEKFDHVWLIRNDGKVPWRDRRLVCLTKESQSIKTDVYEIDVPDTDPGETAEVIIQVDARGNENTFTSTWKMEDSSGNDCFPSEKWLFEFTVTVANKSRESMEA